MSRKGYPSDLTDAEWEIIKEMMEPELPYTTGRPAKVDYREIWNAIFYIDRTGCQWRYLPKDFPPAMTVNYHYLKWMRLGLYQKVNDTLRRRAREREGRNAEPSAGIIDSQSVKGTPESADESGFDGGKHVKGRRRHIVVLPYHSKKCHYMTRKIPYESITCVGCEWFCLGTRGE